MAKDQDFIRKVSMNLPPPHESGPKTEEGRRAVSANSTTHGLTTKGFLRCKADKCLYSEICPILICDPDVLEYGSNCPNEQALFMDIFERFGNHYDMSDDSIYDLITEYAIVEVQCKRAERFFCINSGDIFSNESEKMRLYDMYISFLSRKLEIIKQLLAEK